MEHELLSERGTLSFKVQVGLTGAEPRSKPYSDGLYLPVTLKFTLASTGGDNPHPRYKDLRTGAVSLFGYALKKDGKPGNREVEETFYSHRPYPAWVREILSEHAIRLREGRP